MMWIAIAVIVYLLIKAGERQMAREKEEK